MTNKTGTLPDPVFEQVAQTIRAHLTAQGFMLLVGAKLAALSPGQCTLSVARRPALLQQYGMFHGGVTALLVDNAATVAAMAALEPGQIGLTAEYKLNLLAPAVGDQLTCHAHVVRRGGTLVVVGAGVFSTDGDREKHIATIAVVDPARLPEVRPSGPA